jgi:ketosteroid isomerase-like protein
MDTNEELIRKLFDAFGRRDLEAAVDLFADDAVFHVPGRSGISGTYRGHDGILDYWRRQIELSKGSFRTQVTSVVPEDDHVIVFVATSQLSGKANRPHGDGSWTTGSRVTRSPKLP